MQYLITSLNYIWDQLWPILNPDQELSWRTFLFLCLFAWIMALPTSEGPWLFAKLTGNSQIDGASALFFQMAFARWLLFTTGWICLCISMAWLLVKSAIVIPFFAIKIYPAAWVVGLLTSTYFFIMGTGDVRSAAMVGWPLISAGYTLFPKVVSSSTGKFKAPDHKTLQEFTILFLASATVSCWLQFQVMVQQWITQYPVLLLGSLNESAFVIPVGDRPPVFDIAEATLDQTLQLQSMPQVRTWIQNADQYSDAVNDRFQAKLAAAKNQLLENLLEDMQGKSASEEIPTTAPAEPVLEPEQWSMRVMPDWTDNLGVDLWLELRSRPFDDTITLRRTVSMTYPCIVEPYIPRHDRASRPLDPPTRNPNTLDSNASPTSENVEDYIQTKVQCYDRPDLNVTHISR